MVTDGDLARRATTGDSDAVAELYRRHHGAVAAVCRACGPAGETDDLVHDTFVALLSAAPLNDSDTVLGWLKKTARNRSASAATAHRNSRTAPVADVDVGPIPSRTEHVLDSVVVTALLAALRTSDAALLAAHYLHDQPLARIATTAGTTSGTVKVQLHRARRRARTIGTRQGLSGLVPLPLLRLLRRLTPPAQLLDPILVILLPTALALGTATTGAPAQLTPTATSAAPSTAAQVMPPFVTSPAVTTPVDRLPPATADFVDPTGGGTVTHRDDVADPPQPRGRTALAPQMPAAVPDGTVAASPDTPPDHELGVDSGETGGDTRAGIGVTIHDEPTLDPAAQTACPAMAATPATYCHTP